MDTKSTTEQLKETAERTGENLQDTSEELQNRLGEFWETGREKAAECARATDRVIHEKPYQAIGIALGLGLLTGLLLARSRNGYRED